MLMTDTGQDGLFALYLNVEALQATALASRTMKGTTKVRGVKRLPCPVV
ncbi:MAG: hypothetical protein OXI87_19225 [Albidovulum sp.]|nr:hypothetical protein [Albidovulum sp.]